MLLPLYVYAINAAQHIIDISCAGHYNVGPDERDCCETGRLVELFADKWRDNMRWDGQYDGGPHEASFLKLDCSRIKNMFGWRPRWNVEKAVEKVVEWSECWLSGGDVARCMDQQINEFLNTETDR